jgi:hypothetical protein
MEFTTTKTAAGMAMVTLVVPNRIFTSQKNTGLLLRIVDPSRDIADCDPSHVPDSGLEFRTVLISEPPSVTADSTGSVWHAVAATANQVFTAALSADQLHAHMAHKYRVSNTPGASTIDVTHGTGNIPARIRVCTFNMATGAAIDGAVLDILATEGPEVIGYTVAAAVDVVTPSKTGVESIIHTRVTVPADSSIVSAYIHPTEHLAVSCTDDTAKAATVKCALAWMGSRPVVADFASGELWCASVQTYTNGTRSCMQTWKLTAQASTPVRVSMKMLGVRVTEDSKHLDTPVEMQATITNSRAVVINNQRSLVGIANKGTGVDPIMKVSVISGHNQQTYDVDVTATKAPRLAVMANEDDDICIAIHAQTSLGTTVRIVDTSFTDCAPDTTNYCKHAILVTNAEFNNIFDTIVGGNVSDHNGVSELCFTAISDMRGELDIKWRTTGFDKNVIASISNKKKSVTASLPSSPPSPPPVVSPLKNKKGSGKKGLTTPTPPSPPPPPPTPIETSVSSWCKDASNLCHGHLYIDLIIECEPSRVYNAAAGYCVPK